MPPNAQTTVTGRVTTPNFLTSFSKFHPVTGFNPKQFNQLAILIPGVQGSGKTSLVSTSSDVLRLDFDGSKDNNPNSVASAIQFCKGPSDYRQLVEVVETLEQLARDGKPRPTFVCLDTVDTFLESVKTFVVQNARDKRAQFNAEQAANILTIDDIPGGYGWQKVYEHAEPIIGRIIRAGYGFIMFCYFYEEAITSTDARGQDKVTYRLNHSIPPKFWHKIKGLVDYVCGVGSRIETEIIYGEPRKDGNGNPIKDGSGALIREIKDRVPRTIHYARFWENDRGNQTLKQRIPLPDEIILPSHPENPRLPAPGNFDLLRAAYNTALASISPS